jgi:hypothetical protein
MAGREAPAGFVAELKRRCGTDWDVRWNDELHRWEFTSLSAAGRPVSQFWGWFKNPLTGEPIPPDPVTGLAPFRDLDATAQVEALQNLERSFLGNREDGAGTWVKQFQARHRFNESLKAASRRERAEGFATLIKEVDLKRPWLKHGTIAKREERKRQFLRQVGVQ